MPKYPTATKRKLKGALNKASTSFYRDPDKEHAKERSCKECRDRKVKCSQDRPVCVACAKRARDHGRDSTTCIYTNLSLAEPKPEPEPSTGTRAATAPAIADNARRRAGATAFFAPPPPRRDALGAGPQRTGTLLEEREGKWGDDASAQDRRAPATVLPARRSPSASPLFAHSTLSSPLSSPASSLASSSTGSPPRARFVSPQVGCSSSRSSDTSASDDEPDVSMSDKPEEMGHTSRPSQFQAPSPHPYAHLAAIPLALRPSFTLQPPLARTTSFAYRPSLFVVPRLPTPPTPHQSYLPPMPLDFARPAMFDPPPKPYRCSFHRRVYDEATNLSPPPTRAPSPMYGLAESTATTVSDRNGGEPHDRQHDRHEDAALKERSLLPSEMAAWMSWRGTAQEWAPTSTSRKGS